MVYSVTVVAICCVMCFIPFTSFLFLFLPVPLLVLYLRRGIHLCMIAVIMVTTLLVPIEGMTLALLTGAYLLLTAVGLGRLYIKQKSGYVRLGFLYLVITLAMLGLLSVIEQNTGIGITEYLVESTQPSMEKVMDLYVQNGLISESDSAGLLDEMNVMIGQILPTVALVIAFFLSWISLICIDGVLKKNGLKMVALPSLKDWKMEGTFHQFLLMMAVGLLIFKFLLHNVIPDVYITNLIQLLMILFALYGLSFGIWYFERKTNTKKWGIRIALWALVLVIPMALYAFVLIGIFDAQGNLRNKIKMKEKL